MIIRIDKLLETSNWAVLTNSVSYPSQKMIAEQMVIKLEWMKQLGNDYVLVFKDEDTTNFKVTTKKDVFKFWFPETECENFSCLGSFLIGVAGDINNFDLKSPSSTSGELFIVPSDSGIDLVSPEGKIQYTVSRDLLPEQYISKILDTTKLTLPGKYEVSLKVSDDMLYLKFSEIDRWKTLAILPLSSYQTPIKMKEDF
ncbi:hypothetical protein C3H57_04650 [Campylobacter jejuni]|uniref:Uncharacterized protein n=2 Tax=Campylobacter jejuni TaxID=197 RepID=A0A431EEI4_CAMJU|nr:hypothetical protein C3H57_04650 [Campylobacter jejuni]